MDRFISMTPLQLLLLIGPGMAAEPAAPVVSQKYNFNSFVMTVTPLAPQGPAPLASPRLATPESEMPRTAVAAQPLRPVTSTSVAETDVSTTSTLDFLPPAPIALPPEPGLASTADASEEEDAGDPVRGNPAMGSPVMVNGAINAACSDLAVVTPAVVAHYQQVYDAIPFSRAEYDANPSYRHDATMEFLFGRMRPTLIQRSTTQVDVHMPEVAASPWGYNPYGMNSLYYPFYSPGVRVYRGR